MTTRRKVICQSLNKEAEGPSTFTPVKVLIELTRRKPRVESLGHENVVVTLMENLLWTFGFQI